MPNKSEKRLSSTKLTPQGKTDLLSKIHTACQQTWITLLMKGKQSGGLEHIKKVSLKVPIPACITDDVDKLYALRFNSQSSRLIGYRTNDIFRITHIDMDLSCYDH